MLGILTFIIIFGVIVVVHEFGHFYFAKKSGILVREFAIGMGPKIFSHIDKEGTTYTIRILPLGGYVRMAGWGDDKTEIKTGTPANLTLNKEGIVTRINLSGKQLDNTSLPINVTAYDLEDKLTITGLVLSETKNYSVDHDATIIEEDGTEVRIAPLDVQYQNASVWGRLITNFAGPMNNFILGLVVFIALAFIQGGVQDLSTNQVRVSENGPAASAGLKNNDRILQIGSHKVSNWEQLTAAVEKSTSRLEKNQKLALKIKSKEVVKTINVKPQKVDKSYIIGIMPALKTSFKDKLLGGFKLACESFFRILNELKKLIA
ncbi:RIP metalloprotease RseP, partial [Streptococcus agalactiae]|nr:RIP metalloprotease RseP [Streptococcus agalactiae]